MRKELIDAIADARAGSTDLRNHFGSEGAHQMRLAGLAARRHMEEEWITP
jgi:malonate decarboxylase gamma subunit